jgi:hypothetical protein
LSSTNSSPIWAKSSLKRCCALNNYGSTNGLFCTFEEDPFTCDFTIFFKVSMDASMEPHDVFNSTISSVVSFRVCLFHGWEFYSQD